MSTRKILDEVLRGASDANIRFTDLTNFLLDFGFEKRTRGSHQILFKTGIAEIPQSSTCKLEGETVPGEAGT